MALFQRKTMRNATLTRVGRIGASTPIAKCNGHIIALAWNKSTSWRMYDVRR